MWQLRGLTDIDGSPFLHRIKHGSPWCPTTSLRERERQSRTT